MKVRYDMMNPAEVMMNELIGFNDNIFKPLANVANRATGFPPYDIYYDDVSVLNCDGSMSSETHTFIRLALAGISKDSIRVTLKDNLLEIWNVKPEEEDSKRRYKHRGIAQREFKFQKTIADRLEMVRCFYEDGCLVVEFKEKAKVEPKEEFIPIE